MVSPTVLVRALHLQQQNSSGERLDATYSTVAQVPPWTVHHPVVREAGCCHAEIRIRDRVPGVLDANSIHPKELEMRRPSHVEASGADNDVYIVVLTIFCDQSGLVDVSDITVYG